LGPLSSRGRWGQEPYYLAENRRMTFKKAKEKEYLPSYLKK
jgi:hypothetical protein